MDIKTKFDLGTLVYPIKKVNREETIPCKTCDGFGSVHLLVQPERTVKCPDCYKGGNVKWVGGSWKVRHNKVSEIGKIAIVIGGNNPREVYMIQATGIGGGSIWHANDLFLTEQPAEKECKKRNKQEIKITQ